MANWCSTTIEFSGDETAIKDFYSKLSEYTSKEFVKSDFSNNWLGNIVLGFGFTVDKPNSPRCRGEVIDMSMTDSVIRITTETAWVPMLRMWRMIIDKHYSTEDGDNLIGMTWIAEECGCGIYCTNDMTVWGHDRYHIDSCINDDYDIDYCESEIDAVEFINVVLEHSNREPITAISDLETYELAEDEYISVYELEEVSDDYFE